MPYKKKSPFASFSDPKRAVRRYNPTDFQMPDINSIFEKKADGEVVTQASKDKDKGTAADDSITPSLAKLNDQAKEKETDVTRRSLRQDRRVKEKEFNKKLRQARGLKNASTKDITAEKRAEAQDDFNLLKDEKAFRKRAKKAGFNPEDYRNLKVEPSKVLAEKFNKENISPSNEVNVSGGGNDLSFDLPEVKPDANKEKLKNTKVNYTGFSPNERKAHRVLMGAGASTKDAFDYVTYNFADDETKGMIDRMKASEKEMEEYKKSKGLNMKQVNSKGSGFPMIQPNQNAAEQQMPQQMPNRAGRSVESNQLVNDPNVNQPMNKVPASSFQRNAQFGDIASSPGVPNPAPMPNTIPQASVFPQQPNQQQGAFAAYSSPDRVQNTEAGSVVNAGRNMQEGIEDLGDSFSKKENKKEDKKEDGTNNGLEMNYGPSKALVGNQDRLPEHLKAKIEAAPGMYDGPSMRSAFKAFENDHLKTKVTKGNLKATERDDAAHMSYLKRDVKYDNTHGGSNKQMLNDEKHISKLAGDLKYDAKKKRS